LPLEISSHYGLAAVERIARLVDIAEMHALADGDGALVRRLLLGDHPEQRGLAGAVRPNHADDAAGRQLEGEIIDQFAIAEAFAEAFEVDHVLAQPLGDGDDDLRGLGLLLAGLLQQLFIALIARLGLGLAGFRRSRDPFLLARQRALMRGVFAALLLEPFFCFCCSQDE